MSALCVSVSGCRPALTTPTQPSSWPGWATLSWRRATWPLHCKVGPSTPSYTLLPPFPHLSLSLVLSLPHPSIQCIPPFPGLLLPGSFPPSTLSIPPPLSLDPISLLPHSLPTPSLHSPGPSHHIARLACPYPPAPHALTNSPHSFMLTFTFKFSLCIPSPLLHIPFYTSSLTHPSPYPHNPSLPLHIPPLPITFTSSSHPHRGSSSQETEVCVPVSCDWQQELRQDHLCKRTHWERTGNVSISFSDYPFPTGFSNPHTNKERA